MHPKSSAWWNTQSRSCKKKLSGMSMTFRNTYRVQAHQHKRTDEHPFTKTMLSYSLCWSLIHSQQQHVTGRKATQQLPIMWAHKLKTHTGQNLCSFKSTTTSKSRVLPAMLITLPQTLVFDVALPKISKSKSLTIQNLKPSNNSSVRVCRLQTMLH